MKHDESLKEKIKDRLAYCLSFFKKKPVVVRTQVSTDNDDVEHAVADSLRKQILKRPDLFESFAKYKLRDIGEFYVVGTERRGNRVVYRLYNAETDKSVILDKAFFEFFFEQV